MSAYYKRQVKKYLPAELVTLVNIYYNGPEDMFKKRKKIHKQINDPKQVIYYLTSVWSDPMSFAVFRVSLKSAIRCLQQRTHFHEVGNTYEENYSNHKKILQKLCDKKCVVRIVVCNQANHWYECI